MCCQAMVSLKRVTKFLMAEEVDPDNVQHSPTVGRFIWFNSWNVLNPKFFPIFEMFLLKSKTKAQFEWCQSWFLSKFFLITSEPYSETYNSSFDNQKVQTKIMVCLHVLVNVENLLVLGQIIEVILYLHNLWRLCGFA